MERQAVPKLSDPITLKSLRLKNRIVRSSTWEGLASKDGAATAGLTELLATLVSGGAGLVITGFAYVHASGRVLPYMLGIESDGRIEGLRELTGVIHGRGGNIAIQISHGGFESRPELIGDTSFKVPSVLEGMKRAKLEAEMSRSDIAQMVESFAGAAKRAKAADFDAVQIQASHGYLISQFLSPLSNRRTDDYGGAVQNRARFLFEICESVRRAVGDAFPVLVKMNASDCVEGGLGVDDALWIMKELARMGVDAIEVSGGVASSADQGPSRKNIRAGQGEAYFASFAKTVREAVSPVPVMAVGGIRSFETASNLLASGAADLVALSRPLICEPGLPNRWLGGDRAASACISCSRCFFPGLHGKGIACQQKRRAQK